MMQKLNSDVGCSIIIPPDEQRCCRTDGVKWRCKNFRISGSGENGPDTTYCEKHYNLSKKYEQNYKLKKTSGDDDGDSIQTRDSNCSKKLTEDDRTGIQPHTNDTSSDRIVEGGSANTGTKRKKVERTESSIEPKPLTRIREPVVELESLEHYKSKCFELSVELEKKKVECTELQGKLAEKETKKTAAKDETERTPEDATEYWRKMYLDLESRVLRMENQLESRVSNLESLVLRNGKGGSILRCVELRNSENIKSEAWGLQNEVTQSGEKQRDKNNRSIPYAENNNGGVKDSHVYELKTEEKVLNVYDVGINKHHESKSEFARYSAVNMSSGSLHLSSGGENVGEGKASCCGEQRPSQHGSISQDHLKMSKKPFVNLVSCSGGESYGESFAEDSDSDLMDMMAMKYRNKNKDSETIWKYEADMLSSFEEDPERCMKAVCALYRQQIPEDEISFHYSDALRGTTLGKFLTDGACKGDLKKSVEELEIFNSKAVEDCKRLARSYSKQLFSIYRNRKDPFFLSCYNC